MFDGQFKSKPTVALRGSSHVGVAAGDVIAENRKRRETRKAQRQEEDAALAIQRVIRGFLARSLIKRQGRDRFEHIITQSNLSVSTRLLCNFYDARCDHDRLAKLLDLVERLWTQFTISSNVYPRSMLLLKCVEDSYHQLVALANQNIPSLRFIEKVMTDKSFSAPNFIEQTSLYRITKCYGKLIRTVDILGEAYPCMIRLIQIINTKYHVLILKHFILNKNIANFRKCVDLVFSSSIPGNQSLSFLNSTDSKLIVEKLQENLNVYLDKIVYFLLKLVSDNISCAKTLDVLFELLNQYQIPVEVISSVNDNSSDSSEDEMEDSSPKIVLNFDCLDHIFLRCTEFDASCQIGVSNIAYLVITKFNMSVIQTSPIRWLCLRGGFVRWLWEEVSTKEVAGRPTLCLRRMADNKSLTNCEYQAIVPALTLFCCLFYEYLGASHDADILQGSLFSLPELRDLSCFCRDIAVHMTYLDLIAVQPHKTSNFRSAFTTNRHITIPGSMVEPGSRIVLGVRDWVACWTSVTRLTGELHKRDSRLNFIDNKVEWLSRTRIQNINKGNVAVFIDPLSVPNLSLNTIKELYLLHGIPFTVPFSERVEIFHHILNEDVSLNGGPPPGTRTPGMGHPNSSGVIKASVRRDYIYEDAFAQLTESVAPNLKNRIQVQLINYVGLDEAGVDGGGLFREFLSSFLKEAFNPNRGFFIETDGLLHPNPAAQHLYPDFTKHYYFIGRLLGKAVYEKLLVDLPLAAYFLEKLLGGDANVNHLRSLDADMYRNILSLRSYSEENIADLCLYFIVSDNLLGETKTIELKANGASIQVTKSNLIEYIHLMADYRLNRQIRVHFRNFAEGFYSVVSRDWLKMFSYTEFQSLISGSTADIDVSDLKEHTVYHGSYNAQHPTITIFWNVVNHMTPEQHRKLLAFVTSNDRTPLLGFGALTPLFAIHSAGVEDRLPTASTCMNLLKLPEFSDHETLEKRLLYVIESGAGFELS